MPGLQSMMLDILGACSMHSDDPPCWAPAALRVLASLLALAAEQPLLTDAQLDALLPTLASLLKHQEVRREGAEGLGVGSARQWTGVACTSTCTRRRAPSLHLPNAAWL